jgi:hypothetical protein
VERREGTHVVAVDPVRVAARRRKDVDLEHGIVRGDFLKADVRVPRDVGPARDVLVAAAQSAPDITLWLADDAPVDATALALAVGADELRGGLGDELGRVLADGVAAVSVRAGKVEGDESPTPLT